MSNSRVAFWLSDGFDAGCSSAGRQCRRRHYGAVCAVADVRADPPRTIPRRNCCTCLRNRLPTCLNDSNDAVDVDDDSLALCNLHKWMKQKLNYYIFKLISFSTVYLIITRIMYEMSLWWNRQQLCKKVHPSREMANILKRQMGRKRWMHVVHGWPYCFSCRLLYATR